MNKRILICGRNSYIGVTFKNYVEKNSKGYYVEELSVRGDQWKSFDFSKFDVIFYVAGIAHINSRRKMEQNKDLYYRVNANLAEKVAEKAKESGVKQFVFMSSMSVYGDSAPIGEKKIITKETKPSPTNYYGDSKLQAELKLEKLSDDKFKVVLLRPPMIYGAGCKGNYQTLRKIALKTKFFPKVNNSRSMIYIDNFAEFVKWAIDNGKSGVFCPSNKENVNTCEIVRLISEAHRKKMIFVPGLGWLLKIVSHFTPLVNKAFGSMAYSQDILDDYDCCHYTLSESIKEVEQ